jgi:D-alanyl-D-alanine carboxypeptidase
VPDLIAPAADLNMSVGDFARFAQLHLQGRLGTSTLLTAATWAKLHDPVGDYSLGWWEGSVGGIPASWNEGSASTFDALIVVAPSVNRAVVVMTNANTSWTLLGLSQAAAWMLNLE